MKNLRIVFDMSFVNKSRTGTYVYGHELSSAVGSLSNCEVLPIDGFSTDPSPTVLQKIKTGTKGLRWIQFGLPAALKKLKADVLHSGAFLGPMRAPCPFVLNVFDAFSVTQANWYDYRWRFYARMIEPSMKRAAAVITVSEYSKKQIAKVYNTPENRIQVIYPGVGEPFKS
ncbi:MAG: hypothetical protein C5B54_03910, partial [Acidobacteria bacterium]